MADRQTETGDPIFSYSRGHETFRSNQAPSGLDYNTSLAHAYFYLRYQQPQSHLSQPRRQPTHPRNILCRNSQTQRHQILQNHGLHPNVALPEAIRQRHYDKFHHQLRQRIPLDHGSLEPMLEILRRWNQLKNGGV